MKTMREIACNRTLKNIFAAIATMFLFGLIVGLGAMETQAVEIVDSGTCGDNLTWILNNEGILTICGEGEMEDYGNSPWIDERDDIEKVVIENGVSSIGACAFYGCSSLKSIKIPGSVTSIGGGAFIDCSSLTSLTIPNSVTIIGNSAFERCSGLTNITISDKVTYIGIGVFEQCSSLTNITIPNSVTTIGQSAFVFCSSLTNITIPNGVKGIGLCAFSGCSSLTSIAIPESVTSIGIYAFNGCVKLNDIYFTGTETNKSNISISSGNECIENATWHYNSSGIPKYKIVNSGEAPNIIGLSQSIEDCALQTSSNEYNPQLAHYLAALARAIYSESDISTSLNNLEFKNEDIKYSLEDSSESTLSGFVLAKKTLPNGKAFVLITIRGSVGYNWNNLLDIGNSWKGTGRYPAFENDASHVYDALASFLNGDILTKNAKYVITGHSQGAGAANILTAKLIEDAGVKASDIYDYNFACPNIACFPNDSYWNPGGRYNNIFNIGNVEDNVSFLPSNIMHTMNAYGLAFSPNSTWGKYGRSYWFFPNEINHSAIGHDMKYYLVALSYEYPLSAFADYELVREALIANFIKKVTGAKLTEDIVVTVYKTIGIFCPVNITIYNKSGEPVAAVVDNQAKFYKFEAEKIYIFIDGDRKWISFPADQDYTARFAATGNGTMIYTVFNNFENDQTEDEKVFKEIELTPGKKMISEVSSDIDVSDTKLYVIDEENKVLADVNEDGSENTNVNPYILYTSHIWDEGKTTTPATCTKDGIKTFTCSECKETKTEKIPATGHKWDKGKVTKTATALSAGVKTYTCTVCKKTKTVAINKLTPTIRLSAKKKTLKAKKSFILTVSNLAKGDSIKFVKFSKKKIATVKKGKGNKYKITGKKKGKAVITVTLKSGKKAKCTVTVK